MVAHVSGRRGLVSTLFVELDGFASTGVSRPGLHHVDTITFLLLKKAQLLVDAFIRGCLLHHFGEAPVRVGQQLLS